MQMNIAQNILKLPEDQGEIIFKAKQMETLKHALEGIPLDDNQKRYLRGDIRKKLDVLASLLEKETPDELQNLLNGIENYYITGYTALKNNGFGWYFDPKRIHVINTRVEGTFHIPGGIVKLIRLKTLKNRSFSMNENDGIKYASNEQVLKDAIDHGDEALEMECRSHLKRYGDLFIPDHERYLENGIKGNRKLFIKNR